MIDDTHVNEEDVIQSKKNINIEMIIVHRYGKCHWLFMYLYIKIFMLILNILSLFIAWNLGNILHELNTPFMNTLLFVQKTTIFYVRSE